MNAPIAELTQRNDFFRAAWEEQVATGREGGMRTFAHPARGLLCFEQVTFNLANRPEFKLVILVETRDSAAKSGHQEGIA